MNCGNLRRFLRVSAVVEMVLSLFCLGRPMPAAAQTAGAPPVGPGSTLVHSQFGGQVFGFGIYQNGTEGVLSDSKRLSTGNVVPAVESFDQKTGKILKGVSMAETQDDLLTLGIAGASVGL